MGQILGKICTRVGIFNSSLSVLCHVNSKWMSASRHSTSSMEQGELEASPDLRHSPHIILEPDISSPDRYCMWLLWICCVEFYSLKIFTKWMQLLPWMLWCCRFGIRMSIQPVRYWVMRYWHGYLPGEKCKFFSWCNATPEVPLKARGIS